MQTAKQLLREFWLPLAATAVWTVVNVSTARTDDWTVPKIVNVAATTFFFVSWMTAQYFRVRKQEHVSGSLNDIGQKVVAVTDRLEAQADKLAHLHNSQLVQTFDGCIDAIRDAKEELADKSRKLKHAPNIDPGEFVLHRGNPLYQAR
jgi:hypothetical protein